MLTRDISSLKFPAADWDGDLAELKKVGKAVNLYLRWALTGGRSGPGTPVTMELLGRDVTLQRLEEAKFELNNPEGEESLVGEVAQPTESRIAGQPVNVRGERSIVITYR